MNLLIYIFIWVFSFFIPIIICVLLDRPNMEFTSAIVIILCCIFATLNCIFVRLPKDDE